MSGPTYTYVRIALYKPTGFVDYWRVETDDRGLAARSVMAQYPDSALMYLNLIETTTTRLRADAPICPVLA